MKNLRALIFLSLLLSCDSHLRVNGDRAYAHLKQIVGFGPRLANSKSIVNTRDYIKKELSSYGLKVEEHAFVAETPHGKVNMVNLISTVPGEKSEFLMIASHYDTKDIGDPPCPGANDGGSSTALLLEIAKQLATAGKPKYSMRLVFFDGEEAFIHWTDEDSLYGSRELAKKWEKEGEIQKAKALILLDMVGDADLQITRESLSSDWIADLVKESARELGHTKHFFQKNESITDDHRPFLRLGVPSIDLIDTEYGKLDGSGLGDYWHTEKDTVEHCSAKSLQIVGDVTLLTIEKIQERLAR